MKDFSVSRGTPVVHIVHFSSRPGGFEVLFPVIVNELTDYHFKAYVIRKPFEDQENIYNSMKIPVEYGSHDKTKALLKAFYYFRKYRNDIFHGYNIGPVYLLLMQIAGARKIIYSIHGTIYWKSRVKKILLKKLWLISLKKHVKITSNSEYSKNVFLQKIKQSANIDIVYNPIDGSKFKFAPKNGDGVLKIIYSGRLSKGKNLENWILIASLLHKELGSVYFEIYGEGPLKETLKDQITGLGAENYILLKGFRKNISAVYQGSSLLLFLSEYESFGNVAVESILCGIPVIVSAIPSMKEIFVNYPDFLVKLDDNLGRNVLQKIKNIDYLNSMVPEAAAEFRKRFSVNQHTEKLGTFYNSFSLSN